MRDTRWFIVLAVALAACGAPSEASPGGPLTAAAHDETTPSELQVVCDWDGTHVSPARVAPAEGGIEVFFENPAGDDEYWVRAASSPDDWNHGGAIPKRQTTWSDPAGRYEVMCYPKGEHPPYYESDPRYGTFEMLDPDDLWVEYEAECDDPETLDNEPVPGPGLKADVEQWIRDRYDLHDAELGLAGYPWTQWKAEAPVLTRGDRTMAGWFAYMEQGQWFVRGTACYG